MPPPPSQLFGGARGGVGAGVHYSFHPHPHPTLVNSRDSITFEPPPFHQHPHHHHVHSPSADVGGNTARRAVEHLGGGTFPRKRGDERFRVPSNPSVTGKVMHSLLFFNDVCKFSFQ